MVDFNLNVGGDVQATATVKAPIQDNSKANLINGVADTLGSLFNSLPSAEDRAKAKQQKSLSGYQNELLRLADGVEQGVMSSAQARTRARALHGSFISDNPSLTEKAANIHAKTLSTAGLGEIIGQKDIVTETERDLMGDAAKAGFVFSSMTEQERQEGVVNYRNFLASQQQMKAQVEAIQLKSAQTNLSSSEIRLQDAQLKQAATKHLDNIADTVKVRIRGTIQDVRARVASGQMTQEQAVQQLADQQNMWNSEVNNMARAAGSENLKLVMDPINKMFEIASEEAAGKIQSDVAKNRLEIYQTGIQSKLLEDTNMQKLYGISKLLPNADPTSILPQTSESLKILGDHSFSLDITPGNLWEGNGERSLETQRGLIDTLDKNIRLKDSDPETQEQISNNVLNMLKSVHVYRDAVEKPEQYNQIVDFIASPSYSTWLKSSEYNADISGKAQEVIANAYSRKAMPVVEKWWIEDNPLMSGIAASADVSKSPRDYTSITFSEGGVKFIPKEGARDSLTGTKADGFNTDTMAASANREVAPVVNKIVRATAHLEGHTNYQKVFERDFGEVFDMDIDLEGAEGDIEDFNKKPKKPQGDNVVEGNIGSDTLAFAPSNNVSPADKAISGAMASEDGVIKPMKLQFDDLNEQNAFEIAQQSGAKNPEGAASAKSPAQLAEALIGMSEKDPQANATLAAFIKKNAGININPAKTAWCAAFVNAILGAKDEEGTGKLNARSFLDWGVDAGNKPSIGDVVVLERGNSNWQGHVGFFQGFDENGDILILGGNQSNAVNVKSYDADKLLGFRKAA